MRIGPTVSVVVRTCGRSDLLRICLDSLRHQTENPEEIVIVQAVAADRMPELPELRVITVQQEGRGVSSAANQGIAKATGEVVAFIDDDAFALPNWIEALKKRYIAEPSVAGVGGLVMDKRTDEVWFDRGVIDVFGYAYMRPEEVKSAYPVFPYLAGCNMSFWRNLLKEVGGFDEFYVYSHEEPDLCVRIQQSGLRIVFEPSAVVWHYYAPGPTRRHFAYNSEKSRIYFSLSNFDLPLRQVVARILLRSVREAFVAAFHAIRKRGEVRLTTSRLLEADLGRLVGFLYGIRARMRRRRRFIVPLNRRGKQQGHLN